MKLVLDGLRTATDCELSMIDNGISDETTEKVTLEVAVDTVIQGFLMNTYVDGEGEVTLNRPNFLLVAEAIKSELITIEDGGYTLSSDLQVLVESWINSDYSGILTDSTKSTESTESDESKGSDDKVWCKDCEEFHPKSEVFNIQVNQEDETGLIILEVDGSVVKLPMIALLEITQELVVTQSIIGEIFMN